MKEANTQPLALKVTTFEEVDLLSVYLQDALLTVENIDFEEEQSSFTMILNRFCWEKLGTDKPENSIVRVNTGLRFNNVKRVQQKNLSKSSPQHIISFLAISTINENIIDLKFSEGVVIRLHVTDLSAFVADLTEPYHAARVPEHVLSKSA